MAGLPEVYKWRFPSIRTVGNLRFLTDGSGSATLPILVPAEG